MIASLYFPASRVVPAFHTTETTRTRLKTSLSNAMNEALRRWLNTTLKSTQILLR
jgi:hypothetical protein